MTAIRTLALFALVAAISAAPALAQKTDLFSGFGAKGNGPIEVDAKTLEILEEGNQRISIFSGGVTVRRGNTTMKAAQIKIFSNKDSDAIDQSGFTRMEATGTVYVNSGKQTVTGSQAVVDNKAETIVLSGNVVLSQGKDVLAADRLVIDMATGRARVEQVPGKSIRMVITPDLKKKDGQGGETGTAPATQ
ncbi:MAG TPA: LptA/OstA family protein [Bauldia sp.]|nr:LptA/OstA family protein [Bauldia sp.]